MYGNLFIHHRVFIIYAVKSNLQKHRKWVLWYTNFD